MEDQELLHIFNKNIAYLRRTHRLTQKEMARILGIGTESLRKMEKGITPAKLDCFVLLRAEQHFHIPLADLMKIDLEAADSPAVAP